MVSRNLNSDNNLTELQTTEVDRDQLENPAPPIPARCLHDSSCDNCWEGYPQSRFPNWTYRQVVKSKIQKALTEYNTDEPCILYRVDVNSKGFFSDVDAIVAEHGREEEVWQSLIRSQVCSFIFLTIMLWCCWGVFLFNVLSEATKPSCERCVHRKFIRPHFENAWNKVSALCCWPDCLSLTHSIIRYNIEPFFWSSSLNWIPSRFQADIQPQIGDSKQKVSYRFLYS
jgi:hypothetical protein